MRACHCVQRVRELAGRNKGNARETKKKMGGGKGEEKKDEEEGGKEARKVIRKKGKKEEEEEGPPCSFLSCRFANRGNIELQRSIFNEERRLFADQGMTISKHEQ